jgi:hypothetical protein
VPNDLDGLRLELSGHPALARLFVTSDSPGEAVNVSELESEVAHAWTLAHEAPFAELGNTLTELLPRLETDVRDAADDEQTLHALRAPPTRPPRPLSPVRTSPTPPG